MPSEPLVYLVTDEKLDADIGEGRDDDPNTSLPDKINKAAREWGRKFPGRVLTIIRVPDNTEGAS